MWWEVEEEGRAEGQTRGPERACEHWQGEQRGLEECLGCFYIVNQQGPREGSEWASQKPRTELAGYSRKGLTVPAQLTLGTH